MTCPFLTGTMAISSQARICTRALTGRSEVGCAGTVGGSSSVTLTDWASAAATKTSWQMQTMKSWRIG